MDQRQIAEYLRRMQMQGMNPTAPAVNMDSQVAKAANIPLSSGMASAYIDQAQEAEGIRARSKDISGQERTIGNQRDAAAAMRGQATPQGRSIGPLGVYTQPNIGESLGNMGTKLMGGYMGKKANEADTALDKERSEAGLAKAREELKRRNEDFGLKEDTLDFKVDSAAATLGEQTAGRVASGEQALARLNESIAARGDTNTRHGAGLASTTSNQQAAQEAAAAAATASQGATAEQNRIKAAATLKEAGAGRADANKKGKTKTYVGPNGPLTVIEDIQGTSWITDADGNRDKPIDVSGFKEITEVTNRNLAVTKGELEAMDAVVGAADQADFGITQASDIFRESDDVFYGGSGLGAEAIFTGATGMASPTDIGPRVQEFQRKVQKLGFEGMKEDFERLDLGQIAKNEFDSVAKANANWKTEPYGLVMLQADKIPLYRKAFNAGIKAGTKTPAQRDKQMDKMQDDVIFGAVRIDPSTQQPTVALDTLRRKGIDVTARRGELSEKVQNGTATPEDMQLLTAIITARKAEE